MEEPCAAGAAAPLRGDAEEPKQVSGAEGGRGSCGSGAEGGPSRGYSPRGVLTGAVVLILFPVCQGRSAVGNTLIMIKR